MIDIGRVSTGSTTSVDPSLVSTDGFGNQATENSFQRHVFYDALYGNWWVFYYNSSQGVSYAHSADGVTWVQGKTWPNGWNSNDSPTVIVRGETVVLAAGQDTSGIFSQPTVMTASVFFAFGNITKTGITWGKAMQASVSDTCPAFISCLMYAFSVGATWSGNGQYAIITFDQLFGGSSSSTSYSYLNFIYTAGYPFWNWASVDSDPNSRTIMSTPLAADSSDGFYILYDKTIGSGFGITTGLFSVYTPHVSGSPNPPALVDNNINTNPSASFSAVSDANHGVNVLYRGADGNATSFQISSTSGHWSYSRNIFGGSVTYPAITADYSTNHLQALAVENRSIAMKTFAGNWTDSSPSFPVLTPGPGYPGFLGSNFAASSMTNSSQIGIVWSGSVSGKIYFASIPIQTVWSSYSNPSDPWNGQGIAPYGQYFKNIDESVSTSSGLLTIKETDLSIPGRGLSLDFTRVYNEPYAFQNGGPSVENYPWAQMGNAWQLNFPWMNATKYPQYVHLWNGEGYRIPFAFWTGGSASFENHQGEVFRLLRNSTGTFLYTSWGTAYVFDPTSHGLTKITDPFGNNIIFSYFSGQIAAITDTIGRVFKFCYTNGLLTSIEQNSGICGTGFVRRTVYSYNGQKLVSAADPGGRTTQYTYGLGISGVQNWIITKLTYPTGWYSNYTFAPFLTGSGAYTYRAVKQYVASGTAPIREFLYAYTNGPGDQVSNSTVTSLDGSGGSLQTVSYTLYSFSFAGVSWNVSDANHSFLRGTFQRFGVNGEVPREVILVSPTQGYTNYYRYDLWGNQIYSNVTINSSTNSFHQSFNGYYNDGLPPGFRAFQETFSDTNHTATDNPWSVFNGTWIVRNGMFNGTSPVFNPSSQAIFAWSNFSSPSISMIASIYITKRMATADQRVGLIAHYPGHGVREWALVLHNSTAGARLSLLDETLSWVVENPCPISVGTWYRFNFTISGSQAWGSATAPGISCTVSGTFTSNDITAATGFGLYAGGYASSFANVTLTTIAPSITGVAFSNSFIPNGSPNSNIHNALAGTARLQNGLGSQPEETYYSYTSSGHLYQTTQLHNSRSAQSLTITRTYDAYGNPSTAIDARGNTTYYTFSAKYQSAYLTNQTQVLKPGSTQITTLFGYNFTVGTESWARDPNLNNLTYKYDILGRLTRISYPTGDYEARSYNDTANFVDITNENGLHTRQVYDGLGRLLTIEKFSGGLFYSNQTSTYNWMDKTITNTDPMGNVTRYQYDALSRIVLVTQPDKNSTSSAYNDVASWVQSTDENNVNKCSILDRLGRLVSLVEKATSSCSSGIVTNYYYDEVGNLFKVTTSTSQSTTYAYDNLNRLIKTNYPDGTFESYTYDNNGNLVTKTDRKTVQTLYSYDSINRVTAITYSGTTTTPDLYTYYPNSNLLQLQSQNATIAYTYDSRNRVLSETYTVNTGFNITSSPASLTIGAASSGKSTITLTSINGFAGSVNLTSSAVSGITVSFTPTTVPLTSGGTARSNATISVLGSVSPGTYSVTVTGTSNNPGMVVRSASITVTVPGFTMSLNPTAVGEYCNYLACPYSLVTLSNLTITSFGGVSGPVILSYSGPKSSNVTGPPSASLPPGGTVSVTVNATKLPSKANTDDIWTITGKSGTYSSSTTLDVYYHQCLSKTCPLLPVTSTTPVSAPTLSTSSPSSSPSISYTVSYNYNGELLNTTSYPDGLLVKYSYDSLGRVTTVSKSGTTSNYATFTYNRNDQPVTVTFGNGLVGSYAYDKLSRPTQITLTNSTKALLSLSYSYYKTGTVSSVTGNVTSTKVNEQYSYDVLQRLTYSLVQSGSTNTTLSYSYDSVGNRMSQTLNGGLTSYSYNATNNELKSSSTPGTSTSISYAYDPNGNLNTKTLNTSPAISYAWDPSNRLVRVIAGSALQGAYAYDGMGRRVESVEPPTTTLYAYSGTESLYEQVPGATSSDFIYAAGIRIARVSGATTNYYHTDALGSTRLVTSSTKTILFSDSYQPYGQDNISSGSETYRFTGKPVSQTTGLYFEYQRWYDPSIGRFISPDPKRGHLSNPQSLNLYVYVTNHPTTSTDPTGMDGCWILSSLCNAASTAWNDVSGGASYLYNAAANGYNSLSPEEKQALWIGVGVVAIVATGGAAAPLVLGVGLAVGAGAVGAYAGYSYATGQQITLSGALTAFSIGFAVGSLGAGLAVSAGVLGSDAAEATGAFTATREGVSYGLGPDAESHLTDLMGAFGTDRAGALSLIKSTVEEGADTTAFEPQPLGRLAIRSLGDITVTSRGLSTPFAVLEPDTGTIVTAFPKTLQDILDPLGLSI